MEHTISVSYSLIHNPLIYLSIYLPTLLKFFLLSSFLSLSLPYPPTPSSLLVYTYLPTCLPTTYPPTHPLTYIPTYLLLHLLNYLPIHHAIYFDSSLYSYRVYVSKGNDFGFFMTPQLDSVFSFFPFFFFSRPSLPLVFLSSSFLKKQ